MKICPYCGKQANDNDVFCIECGGRLDSQLVQQQTTTYQQPIAYQQPVAYQQPRSLLRCRRCGSDNISVQAVTHVQTKHRGCIAWFFWIILAICTIGLILIIPAITNSKTKSQTHTEAVCQNCGFRWWVY